jgi:hypothetical protein
VAVAEALVPHSRRFVIDRKERLDSQFLERHILRRSKRHERTEPSELEVAFPDVNRYPSVRSVADIHLVFMPYSHSVGTAIGAAALAWLILERGMGRVALGRAIGIGIVSHLILDLATHAHDIALWPGWTTPKLGLGLYGEAPLAAFALELAYGLLCWFVYRGNKGLLALGPERYLANRPTLAVSAILVQIVITLVLVGVLARSRRPVSHQPAASPLIPGESPFARRVRS